MTGTTLLIVLLVAALVAAVLLAAGEAALLRVPRVRVLTLADGGSRRARRLALLLDDLPRVLNAVLLAALLAQLGAASIAGLLAARWFGNVAVSAATLVLALVLFVYGEAIPKTYAIRHPTKVALGLVYPLAGLAAILRPLVAVLVWLADLQAPGRGIGAPPTVTEDELLRLASDAAVEGEITDADRELIVRALRFGDLVAEQVMVPRTDIVGVPVEATVEAAIEAALDSGHRRLPVYEQSLDRVVGVVHVRELIEVYRRDPSSPVASVAIEPLLVPETKRVSELLSEMEAAASHMAVVIDEFGGTAGLVTIEDIVQELAGAVVDETRPFRPAIRQLGANRWIVDGGMPIDDLEALLDVELPVGEWTTAAGMLLGLTGRLLGRGEEVEAAGYRFRVAFVRGRRIIRIEIGPS